MTDKPDVGIQVFFCDVIQQAWTARLHTSPYFPTILRVCRSPVPPTIFGGEGFCTGLRLQYAFFNLIKLITDQAIWLIDISSPARNSSLTILLYASTFLVTVDKILDVVVAFGTIFLQHGYY